MSLKSFNKHQRSKIYKSQQKQQQSPVPLLQQEEQLEPEQPSPVYNPIETIEIEAPEQPSHSPAASTSIITALSDVTTEREAPEL